MACAFVVSTGAFGVAGWLMELSVFQDLLLLDLPPMRGVKAACILLLGISLGFLQSDSRLLNFTARVFSAIALTLGLLSEFGFFSGKWVGVSAALFPTLEFTPHLSTYLAIIPSSLAVFLIDYQGRSKWRPSQWLAIVVIISGLWTVLRYVFTVAAPDLRPPAECSMAPLAATAFLIFGTGILLSRPASGVMELFLSSSAAGQMARRILPAGILMLTAIGAATIAGQRSGLYDSALHNTLFTIGSIILITGLIWVNAHAIDLSEKERQQAIKAAKQHREWLQVMLSSIADAVIATDETGHVQFLNPVAEKLTGWPEREAVGLPAAKIFHLLDTSNNLPLENPVQRVLNHGGITRHSAFATLIARDGTAIPVEDKAAPILDSRAAIVGCVVVFRDVSERRRADEMRQEVAAQYAKAAEAIPQIVWTAGANGLVDFFNQRWFDYTGFSFDNSRGHAWLSAFHPDDEARCAEEWHTSIASGSRYEVEARIVRKDGVSRWHLIRALPVHDRAGRINKWFGTSTDIEDQKRAEEAMRFLADASTLLSASLDEISTLQSVAELAVPKIADLCTVHLVSEMGLQLAAVSHMDPRKVELVVEIDRRFPPSPERTKGITQVIRSGMAELAAEIDDWLLEALSADEHHRKILHELGLRSTMSVPLRGHREILGVITFSTMESGRRFTTRDLSLAEEVARRTALALDNNRLLAEITATKVEAEAANAAKDQFLAVLSHELRTPLTPVLLAADELSRDPSISDSMRKVMEMTRRNIELEARLIDDLLDLTRIQRGKLQLQKAPTDAHALLQSAIDICRADIDSKHLCVSLGLSAAKHHIHADPARLQQVFWNLIKNAVKFTAQGGSLIFRSRNTGKDRIQIEVEDTGIGIEPALLSKIFNAFEQGEKSRGRRFGGLGLGLAITKNLVEAHGGTISAHSPGLDLGTKFVIEFTITEWSGIPRHNPSDTPQKTGRSRELRILLVEDNCETGALLCKILERRGYQVDYGATMEAALELAKRFSYDLLLSDIGLPDGSGLELMQALQKTARIPGIAMSGFGMDDDLRRSRDAGFSEHLTKPISIAKLEEAIEKITAGLAEG